MALAPVMARAESSPIVLDRAAAVVNRQVILESDVEAEIRLSAIDPNQADSQQGKERLSPRQALAQLITRALVEQQIRQEDAEASLPTAAEVQKRIARLRRQLPACARADCASDAGWKAFLAARGLTPEGVNAYMRSRMEILRFIEQRFRAGIRISRPEIESYYRQTLLPHYSSGESAPPLDRVSSRIEKILVEQRVNVLFNQWLANLRKQGDVEILDPAFDSADQRQAAEMPQNGGSVDADSGIDK